MLLSGFSFHQLPNVLTPNQVLTGVNYSADLNNFVNPYQINTMTSNSNKRPMRTVPLSSSRAAASLYRTNIYNNTSSKGGLANANVKKQASAQVNTLQAQTQLLTRKEFCFNFE